MDSVTKVMGTGEKGSGFITTTGPLVHLTENILRSTQKNVTISRKTVSWGMLYHTPILTLRNVLP